MIEIRSTQIETTIEEKVRDYKELQAQINTIQEKASCIKDRLRSKIEFDRFRFGYYNLNKRGNDISFLLDGRFIVLMEHQSSINKNMPLRILMYIARVYEKIIDNKLFYREKLIKIPLPEFIVLYNGHKNQSEEQWSKLSDAFLEPSDALELKIKCININYGKSKTILDRSKTLQDYSYFIHLVNQYKNQGNQIEDSIHLAIKDCLQQDILEDFLQEHGSEVVNMLYTEFNLEDAKEVWREEGREEGKKQGIVKVAISLLGVLEDDVIAEKTGLTIEEIKQLRKENEK